MVFCHEKNGSLFLYLNDKQLDQNGDVLVDFHCKSPFFWGV